MGRIVKTKIYEDDHYPFYRLDDNWGSERSVPEEKYNEWKRVMSEFYRVQKEIEEVYHNRNPKE